MAQAPVYNFKGDVVETKKLDDAIFGMRVKPQLVNDAVIAQMANSRTVIAHTKDRSEVRGGGKKPWRQKGTGRARHGSIRSPIWKGGGVTFGPTKDRVYTLKINKKVKRAALKMVLTDKVSDKKLYLIEDLVLPQKKTQIAFELLENLKLRMNKKKEASILLVLSKDQKELVKFFKNIEKVNTIGVNSLNVIDILKNQYLIMPVKCLETIGEIYK